MKEFIVTTSWDDGDLLDLKLARLLQKYGIKGTFYVPKKYRVNSFSENEIIFLSKNFEIGSHTLSHSTLDEVSINQAELEIRDSKNYLENLIGQKIKMFAYPRGCFNEKIKKIIKESGYSGARSTQAHYFDVPADLYNFQVTLCLYPFPIRLILAILRTKKTNQFFKKIRRSFYYNFYYFKKNNLPINSVFSWGNLAINYFNHVRQRGKIFHLFGHSWEVEMYNLWDDLEFFLKYISKDKNIKFLTNSEAIEYFYNDKTIRS